MPPAELRRRERRARDPVARARGQTVRPRAAGRLTAEVAAAAGFSSNWVREVARRWREGGPDALGRGAARTPSATAATPTPAPPPLAAAARGELAAAPAGPAPGGGARF